MDSFLSISCFSRFCVKFFQKQVSDIMNHRYLNFNFMSKQQIVLKKVKVHNLKSVDLTLDHHQLIVFTGVSGSGKSSLAFDTIYIEGQRRYVESLSTYARRHLGDLPKPD